MLRSLVGSEMCIRDRHHNHAITSGTMPAPLEGKVPDLHCPLCRAPTLPFDILGCAIDEASFYSDRANLIQQHRSRFAPRAEELVAEAYLQAAAVLDRALGAGRNEECEADVFYENVMFKRAEIAAAMGEYAVGVDLLAESTATFQEGGKNAYQMSDQNGRANYYGHFRLHAHCLLGAGRAAEAHEVLTAGVKVVQQDMGTHAKLDRDFYADLTWSLYSLGQYEQAIEVGQGAVIEANRTYAQCHKYVALSQQALGMIGEAVTTMRQAVCYETPWDAANLDEARGLLCELLEAAEAEEAPCLLYTSDAADEEDSVDLGGRRIIKKKKKEDGERRKQLLCTKVVVKDTNTET
eukprot:TRINITY_DN50320_c0_g1_i1.p1 TRINITY_DN50320_c0_g1~~TRINITY_DN50320_c0_g1_i1.p1  ORF type:complete len:351 (-),score=65.62 TRINITY_DN50320_c0_g1_i1:22-1074(-)